MAKPSWHGRNKMESMQGVSVATLIIEF